MSKKPKSPDLNEDQVLNDANTAENETVAENQAAEGDNVSDEDKEETQATENWEQKFNELNDNYLRLHADFDNYRKRTLKEKSELLRSGSERVISGILPVVDDFERAITNLQSAENMDALKEGVDLIYSKFLSFLEKNGVKAMETNGLPFDADQHEALTMIPAPSEEMKNKIIDTVVKGYTLDGKVMRFPKVVVAQ
ncbi:MAG: Protein GrpE [Bacteroidetes bacterium]|jgi:molecular chaperone GrpE|nr:Protein GrpE [Bacteroidota bacterium]